MQTSYLKQWKEFGDIMDDIEIKNIRNVEKITNVAEYIRNVDPEQFANIRDEFEMLDEMEVEYNGPRVI